LHNQTHYQTLGLPDGADVGAVERAYRKVLQRFFRHQQAGHPLPEADFQLLEAAWLVLGNPVQKATYDRELLGDVEATLSNLPHLENLTDGVDNALQLEEDEVLAPRHYSFRFTGSGREYFPIWIVNLLLTIATGGIYWAWAVVRQKQYFCHHTLLNDQPFDYRGDPLVLFKGFVAFAILLFAGWVTKKYIHDWINLFRLATTFVFYPLLLLQWFRFHARNTSWRKTPFGFNGSYLGSIFVVIYYSLIALLIMLAVESLLKFTAILAFLVCALVGMFLSPVLASHAMRFRYNNLSFGEERMVCKFGNLVFHGIYWRAWCLVLLLSLPAFWLFSLFGKAPRLPGAAGSMVLFIATFTAAIYLSICLCIPYIQAQKTNLAWNNARGGAYRFSSDQKFWPLCKIYMLNSLLLLLTLGLYWPWAKVKVSIYRAEHLTLIACPDSKL
jgi:uncharacterized membrane protein YjgN (DUF898 family)